MRPAVAAVVPAGIFVLGVLAAGALFGVGRTAAGCARHPVHLLPVVLHNGLLDLLLMSGLVTLGTSTLVLGGVLLATTGASIGGIVSSYGTHGALLLAPHGVLELLSSVAAAAVGLLPLTSRLHPRGSRAALAGPTTAAYALTAGLLVVIAGAVENLWTGWYGPTLAC